MPPRKKEYRHRKTSYLAQESTENVGYYYISRLDSFFPKVMIEDSNDWEFIPFTITEKDFSLPLFSYYDILKMSESDGHHLRSFTSSELLDLLKSKLV